MVGVEGGSQGAGFVQLHLSGEQGAVRAVALDVDDGALLLVERVGEGVEQGDVVIAVLAAVPAPVHTHPALLVVAVEHEGMAAAVYRVGVGARIVDGPAVVELLKENVHPFVLRVAVAGEVAGFAEAKIAVEGVGGVLRIGTGAFRAVLHVDSDATMITELGHGIGLLLGVGDGGVEVEHVVIVVGGTAEVGCVGLAFQPQRVGAFTVSRGAVIVEYLRHGGGHAAHHAGVGGDGALVPIGVGLAPLGAHHRGDGGSVFGRVGGHHTQGLVGLACLARHLLHALQPPLVVGIVALLPVGLG